MPNTIERKQRYNLSNLKVTRLRYETFEGCIMIWRVNDKAEHLHSLIILHNW